MFQDQTFSVEHTIDYSNRPSQYSNGHLQVMDHLEEKFFDGVATKHLLDFLNEYQKTHLEHEIQGMYRILKLSKADLGMSKQEIMSLDLEKRRVAQNSQQA